MYNASVKIRRNSTSVSIRKASNNGTSQAESPFHIHPSCHGNSNSSFFTDLKGYFAIDDDNSPIRRFGTLKIEKLSFFGDGFSAQLSLMTRKLGICYYSRALMQSKQMLAVPQRRTARRTTWR